MRDATRAAESIVEEMIGHLLATWPGLHMYVQSRRAGGPPDETMDILLRELLKLDLRVEARVGSVIAMLLQPPPAACPDPRSC